MNEAVTIAPFADPRPEDVRRALERVVLRWRQLPLERAERQVVEVRALAQLFADRVAGPTAPLPALGAAVVIDQLCVAAYDLCAATHSLGVVEELSRLLALLR